MTGAAEISGDRTHDISQTSGGHRHSNKLIQMFDLADRDFE